MTLCVLHGEHFTQTPHFLLVCCCPLHKPFCAGFFNSHWLGRERHAADVIHTDLCLSWPFRTFYRWSIFRHMEGLLLPFCYFWSIQFPPVPFLIQSNYSSLGFHNVSGDVTSKIWNLIPSEVKPALLWLVNSGEHVANATCCNRCASALHQSFLEQMHNSRKETTHTF